MWSASDWDRPLSPLSKGRRCSKHASGLVSIAQLHSTQQGVDQTSRPQTRQDIRRHSHGGSQHLPQYGHGHGPQQSVLAASAPPTPTGAHTHTTQEIRPATAGSQLTIHYLGIARGELGVLSKKQEIPERPMTAPVEVKRAVKAQPGWQPIYHTQDAVEQYRRGALPRDMRVIVDDPVGKSAVQHSRLPGHGLQLTVAVQPHRCALPSSWNARPANKNLTARWHGRVLSAGGFPGWKLSHGGRGGFTKCTASQGGLLPVSRSGVRSEVYAESAVQEDSAENNDAGQVEEEAGELEPDAAGNTGEVELDHAQDGAAETESAPLLADGSISAYAHSKHSSLQDGSQALALAEVSQIEHAAGSLDKPADGYDDD